jgi:cell division GTPase FtsZ|tara:strand:+ start:2403 stop:3554 length:1152 start_codon:yes stop_codon:yes gene_type:complete
MSKNDDFWLYHNGDKNNMPDLELPEDLIIEPEAQEEKPSQLIKDEVDVAFNFAFIGAGQGGSRIAETFHKIGYRRVAAINTAQQDLNSVGFENKKCIGDGGAGKDPSVAEQLYNNNKEDVLDFLKYSFGEGVDKIFVCVGAGGGSGAGTMEPLVRSSKELQEANKSRSNKVGVILALPKYSEGKKVCANAIATLERANKLVEEGIVSPLIVVDNEKITKMYPSLSVTKFWHTANMSVAGVFHLFNMISAKDSSYTSFDKTDYETVLESGNLIFGTSKVKDYSDPISVARSVRENLKNNLLSGGFDLKTGNMAAAVAIASTETLDNIPESSLDAAFDQLNRLLGEGSTVHRGVYSGNKPDLTIFTTVGGLAKPTEKIEELKTQT